MFMYLVFQSGTNVISTLCFAQNVVSLQEQLQIELFTFLSPASWHQCTAPVVVNTVKGSNNAKDKKTAWQLSVEGNVHVPGAQSSRDIVQARLTFVAGTAVYAIRFPSTAAAVHFGQVYARRLWQHV